MLLIVDDEFDLCEILRFNLESEGFEVECANSAEQALELIHSSKTNIELILLDVMMDRMSGFDMAKALRSENNNVPIIFLTALNQEASQLEGFGVGADDYITKPFSFPTVLARVRAVLKRTNGTAQDASQPEALLFDKKRGMVTFRGNPIQLTPKEFAILVLLAETPGTYFTREEILAKVWDDDIYVGERSVDVHIARLRKKMGEAGALITNRTGFGYVYDEQKIR